MTYIRQKTWTFYLTNKTKIRIVKTGEQNHLSLLSAYHRRSLFTEKLSHSLLSGKIISTNDLDITNKIIRGTNRQNIVYDEAFECTRDFHKLLEELFTVLSENQSNNKIYYERRSKQFYNNTSIKSYQKVSFRILIQSFISIFLNEPHMGHKHESRLLQLYKGKIFIDTQSKLPYYVSSLISIKLDQILKKKISYKHIRTYKSQIQMIIRILAGGYKYDINNEKNIDTYCNNLLPHIYDDDTFKNFVSNAINIFNDTVSEWVNQKGEDYKYAIKDSSDFTNFLLDKLRVSSQTNISYRGIVSKIALDKSHIKSRKVRCLCGFPAFCLLFELDFS